MAKAKKSNVKKVEKEEVIKEEVEVQEEEVIKDADQVQAGFLSEITKRINAANSIGDLEKLQQRVYDIWMDKVPNEIQTLAAKKGEELTDVENSLVESAKKENETPVGWVKCSLEKVKEAEKAGTLAGWDEEEGLALINKK